MRARPNPIQWPGMARHATTGGLLRDTVEREYHFAQADPLELQLRLWHKPALRVPLRVELLSWFLLCLAGCLLGYLVASLTLVMTP